MRVVLQRVTHAKVVVNSQIVGEIGRGLVILIGVSKVDTEKDAEYLASKITNIRLFEDTQGKMNRTLSEAGGSALIISQFTLYGDCRKGRRPSFDAVAGLYEAKRLYDYFVDCMRQTGTQVATGIFQAQMQVCLVNDGPVTIIIESK
jgi:D-tyrosyl-tRNA(Tyr) deacylase